MVLQFKPPSESCGGLVKAKIATPPPVAVEVGLAVGSEIWHL